MKIKVIDLLNMISKGEEVPEKIRHNDIIFTYYENADEIGKLYIWEKDNIFWFDKDFFNLDTKVEIIEEEKLMFEEINELSVPHKLAVNVDLGEDENSIQYKVNQLIRNQKKIINELKKGK